MVVTFCRDADAGVVIWMKLTNFRLEIEKMFFFVKWRCLVYIAIIIIL